jgi:hypothetical protein
MKSIKFSEHEIEMLISNYQMELGEALDYIEQIKGMLEKLGAPVQEKIEKIKEKKEKKTGKKRGPKPSQKPVVAKEPKKRGRKPKVVVPTLDEVTLPEATPVIEVKVKTETKKIAGKTKVVAEKKPVVKPEPKKKPEPKVAAKVESVVTSLLNKAPKKEVKKVANKKSPAKKRQNEMAASEKINKPATKKVAKAKPVVEVPPVAPVAPIEQS